MENLDIDALAGIPFMESNDISVWPYKHQVLIGDTFVIYTLMDLLSQNNVTPKAHVLRTVAPTTI